MIRADVADLHQLGSDLERTPDVAERMLRPAVAAVADETSRDIAARAPTPAIAASVEVRLDPVDAAADVLPTDPLAHLFEFGTGPRFQKRTGRFTGVMPPQPYIAPADEQAAGRLETAIANIPLGL